jgi:gamma-glutamylcyclotransferase (GGCT)/AIG2-like uncharacterized protein YtfP
MHDTPRPIHKFVQSRLDDSFYSQDSAALFKKKWHPLFVYGSLKRGFIRNNALEGSYFLGSAFTRNTGWTMYQMKGRHSFPMIFTPAGNDIPGSVFGEVYLVPPYKIKMLDLIESNGILYSRQYRTVDFHTRQGDQIVMAVWMYLSERKTWQKAIDLGTCVPCETFQRKDKPGFKYYLYKKDNECPVAQSAITPQKTAVPF